MQKVFIYVILLSFQASLTHGQSENGANKTAISIKYGIDQNYEPYEFFNIESSEVEGFNVELIQAIGKNLNLAVDVYPDIWRNTRENLEVTRKLNVAAYFKSEGTEREVLYSKPITLVYYSIFTQSGKEPIEDLFNLDGKKVAIQELTIVEEYFEHIGFLELDTLVSYASENEALQAVMRGDVDCAITSFITTNYKMKEEGITSIQSSSDPVFIAEYCFVVHPSDRALLDSLNWGLRLVKASGEYDLIYQKWLAPEKSWLEENKQLLTLSLAIILLLTALCIIYIYSLRKLVSKKTKQIVNEIQFKNETQKELKESETLRKKTERFTSMMLVETDLEHRITEAPKLFHQTLSFEPGELNGLAFHQLLLQEDVVKDSGIKNSLLNQEFIYLDAEYEFKSNSHVPVYMDCSISLLKNNQQQIIGFIHFLRDITPLKTANLSLKDLNAELANFMYKTSHDVRGPIANILGLGNLGQMVSEDKEIINYFNLINSSTKKLELIFDDFKEVSFILQGDLVMTTFDINELIDEVIISVFRKRNKDIKKANFNFIINMETSFITSDRALLKRIFFQLIENVFEHNTYYNTKLKIMMEKVNPFKYRIFVEDDGVGIPEELHRKVFEVFFKGKNSGINIGMGLYIAKKAIDRLGGHLKLRSRSGSGTTVEILLPAAKKVDELNYN